jgi:hypothetical protein
MSKKELTVEEIMFVTGWSYPTARNWAKEHGNLRRVGVGFGKYFVPTSAIQAEVDKRMADVLEMETRLDTATSNGHQAS